MYLRTGSLKAQAQNFFKKTKNIVQFSLPTSTLSQNINCSKGAITYDVRCFGGIFDLPFYPNQILYYISLFSEIRFSLTYLPI